jgi:hypothetical protein
MGDIFSVLQSSVQSAASATPPSRTKYVPVDAKLYQGNWSGTYSDKKTFTISVNDVNGFRAHVQYQSGGTAQSQDVLIKDNSFRFGNTKFTLTKAGTAQIKNVIVDPATGSTFLDTAVATQN